MVMFTHLNSLCLYFIRTVPVLTSMIQIEFPPHVATLDVVLEASSGSGSKTTSQICVWMSAGSLFLLCDRMKWTGSKLRGSSEASDEEPAAELQIFNLKGRKTKIPEMTAVTDLEPVTQS